MRHFKHKKQYRKLSAPCRDKCAHASFQAARIACRVLLSQSPLPKGKGLKGDFQG